MTEEYDGVSKYISKENENGRPCRKNPGAGVKILKPDLEKNSYKTMTHKKLLTKETGTTIEEA